VRAAQTEVETRESGDDKVADCVSLSVGNRKPCFTRMVIEWGLTGGATGTAFAGCDC
jgi:hypothetical protein